MTPNASSAGLSKDVGDDRLDRVEILRSQLVVGYLVFRQWVKPALERWLFGDDGMAERELADQSRP